MTAFWLACFPKPLKPAQVSASLEVLTADKRRADARIVQLDADARRDARTRRYTLISLGEKLSFFSKDFSASLCIGLVSGTLRRI